MSEFEDYIKARYPVDYDSLKEKYPNVHVCEFYGDEQDLWDLKQAEIDDSENTRAVLYRENTDIREKNTDLQAKIELLEKEITETQAFLNNQNHIKQAKIDELEAKNEKTQKQFNFLLDKNIRDESAHATLKLKFMEVSRLVRSLRNEFDLNDDCQQTDRQIELLEELLRGEHE